MLKWLILGKLYGMGLWFHVGVIAFFSMAPLLALFILYLIYWQDRIKK